MNMEEAVVLLKDILAIRSVNGSDDEGKVAEYLCGYFQKAGIPASVQRIDETHANVTAFLEGESRETAVWNGHLDTVPYGDLNKWGTDPAEPVLKDGYLYGRGASDMKSGLAAMAYALCDFHRQGKKPARSVQFIGTCDEEKGGLGAKQILEAGLMADTKELLIGEPTGCALGIAQKGCLWLEILLYGKTSHGAYPEEGCNAVECGVGIARQIKKYVESFNHPVLGSSTAQITQISGGVAPNMTPDACTILMDIRLTPGLDSRMVLSEAESGAEKMRLQSPGLSVAFSVKNDRRAVEIQREHPMAVKLENCLKKQGRDVSHIGINYFTDASVLVKDAPETGVLLFGPGEPDMAHKPDERVSLTEYGLAVRIFLTMLE